LCPYVAYIRAFLFFGAYRGFRNLWGFNMYHHVANCRRKALLKQTISVFFMLFFSLQLYAVDQGDWFLQRQITVGDGKNAYGKKIYGTAARAVMEEVPIKGTTQTEVRELIKRSIAVDKPTATKVGSSMLKRIYSPQAIVGTAAVTGLLGAIGWVMEEGTYVKYKDADTPDNEYEYKAGDVGTCSPAWNRNASAAGSAFLACSGTVLDAVGDKLIIYSAVVKGNSPNYYLSIDTAIKDPSGYVFNRSQSDYGLEKRRTNLPPTEKTKIPLTAALLGAAMLGSQYVDPDPKFDNTRVNTGDYTGVKETYEHDPSGVGNEQADVMDDKLKNAKPTDDDEPSYIGDPKYDDKPLGDDRDDSSDRGWDEKGDEATGGTEPEKDPETGEPTGNQSITLQFPLFCAWASKMCLWYDDWKASDKVYKDHMTKTEEHQTEEKSFWSSVKNWFDWTKDESINDDDNETPEIINEIPLPELNTGTFQASAGCPPPIAVPIDFGTQGEIQISYEPICQMAQKWSFVAPLIGFLSGAMILVGVGRKGEDGEI
jgi:hypothetical protein